jgi:hypothetical protein
MKVTLSACHNCASPPPTVSPPRVAFDDQPEVDAQPQADHGCYNNLHTNIGQYNKWAENDKAREEGEREEGERRKQEGQASRNRVVVLMRTVFSERQFSVKGRFCL